MISHSLKGETNMKTIVHRNITDLINYHKREHRWGEDNFFIKALREVEKTEKEKVKQ